MSVLAFGISIGCAPFMANLKPCRIIGLLAIIE
jgi:hypothetical protein